MTYIVGFLAGVVLTILWYQLEQKLNSGAYRRATAILMIQESQKARLETKDFQDAFLEVFRTLNTFQACSLDELRKIAAATEREGRTDS